MNKSLLAILVAALIMSVSAYSMEEVKTIVRSDKCASDAMVGLRPNIEVQIAKLREDKNDVAAKAELITLVRKVKLVFDECDLATKVQPQLGDAVEAVGISFLLASNCFKDVGIVFLIADDVIQDPSDIVGDIVVAIVVAVLGRQGYKDCSQFVNFIVG